MMWFDAFFTGTGISHSLGQAELVKPEDVICLETLERFRC